MRKLGLTLVVLLIVVAEVLFLLRPFRHMVEVTEDLEKTVINRGDVPLNKNRVNPFNGDYVKTAITDKRTHNYPPFIGLPNSSFRSPYHKYWETNCSLVFKQDEVVLKATTELIIKSLRGDTFPSDKGFSRYTNSCSVFREVRNYPKEPLSKEEEDYPVAYIITTHQHIAQVERLLRAIYQPQNIYCIHPDGKSPATFYESVKNLASCFPNVFIPSRIEEVQYAGISRLRADINCMEDLLQKPVQWKYVINLCGQDFPLKTNLEIVHQLKAGLNHNFIECDVQPHHKRPGTRFRHVGGRDTPLLTKTEKDPPPYNFTVYAGSAYYAATRDFVQFVVRDDRALALLEWSKDTYIPAEHYWATLQAYPGVPGGYPDAFRLGRNFRYAIRSGQRFGPPCIGMYVRYVCVFSMGSLKYLLSQPRAFANKFYYDFDPVTLQCLEEMLDYRQSYPESIHEFVPEFPITKLIWKGDPALS